MKTRLALFGALAFAAYLAYGVYRAGTSEITPPPQQQTVVLRGGKAEGESMRGNTLTWHSWSIDYERVAMNADQTIVELQGIRNGIYYKSGKPFLRLRATHVTLNTATHDFSADGPLHVETVDRAKPMSFETTSAVWSEVAQKLSLPKSVTVTSAAQEPLHIAGITIDVKSGDVHLSGVSGSVKF